MAVDVRLALAKQIEIGAVQYVNDAVHFKSEFAELAMVSVLLMGQSWIAAIVRFWRDGAGRFNQFDSDISQHLRQCGYGQGQRPARGNEMGPNASGHIWVIRSIEYDDIGNQVLVGFGNC